MAAGIHDKQIWEISSYWKLLFGTGKQGRESGRQHLIQWASGNIDRPLSEQASRKELDVVEAAKYILALQHQYEARLATFRERVA